MGESVVLVDVIVPVFRDLGRTRACIESVAASRNETRFHLIVVNDASPEPDVARWLRESARTVPFELIEHDTNRGFVASVNECMRLHRDRDVVLLNSDTEVANDWLDRLLACAARAEDVGTVTPFSNNATICSFPFANLANPLPVGWSTARVDALFARINAGRSMPIPTGVGFCMLIRRACLEAVGYFDEARFGRGYGEENDFCLRAEAQGWRNLLCADTFVFHAGGVSFGSAAENLQASAAAVMEQVHPGYHDRVRAFVAEDPIAPLRAAVADTLILESLVDTIVAGHCVLHVLGLRGGGSAAHVRQLVNLPAAQTGFCHLILFLGAGVAVLEDTRTGWYYPLDADLDPAAFADALVKHLGFVTMHWHLINEPALNLADALRGKGVRQVVTLHDIGFSSRSAFSRISQGSSTDNEEEWRHRITSLLEAVEAVLAPSHFIADLCRTVTGGRVEPRVLPHPADFRPSVPTCVPEAQIQGWRVAAGFSNDGPVVALVGAMGEHKGAVHWRRTREVALQRQIDINWVLIGYADPELTPAVQPRCVIHGAYTPEELPSLLRSYGVDIVYFPPGTPESFCYALSDVWMAGWPVAVHDLGALGERVSEHPEGGVILGADLDPDETLDVLLGSFENPSGLAAMRDRVRASAQSWLETPERVAAVMREIWMDPVRDERASGPSLLDSQLLRTHLDEGAFRIELTRLSRENKNLTLQAESLVEGLEQVRELAHQRELWGQKLATDISALQESIREREIRVRQLERVVDEFRELAHQREIWSQKLEQDIVELKQAYKELLRVNHELSVDNQRLLGELENSYQWSFKRVMRLLGNRSKEASR